MNRYAKVRSTPNVKRKQKIELNNKNIGLRTIFFFVFLILSIAGFAYGVKSCLEVETGWETISSNSVYDYDDYFTLKYYLDNDTITTKKAVSVMYQSLIEDGYELYSSFLDSDSYNVKYINSNPNTTITIDHSLYTAFEKINSSNLSRILFMGPLYYFYGYILASEADYEAMNNDPLYNSETKDLFDELLTYITDENCISLSLLGNDKIKLNVSNSYLNYASESLDNYPYMDFMYLQNAFVIDYVVDGLVASGYNNGIMNSIDGYTRSFTNCNITYNIYDYVNSEKKAISNYSYTGNKAVISLNSFSLSSSTDYLYYTYENGLTRSPYITYNDYSNTVMSSSFNVIGDNYSLSNLLLKVLPVYFNNTISNTIIKNICGENISLSYTKNNTLYICNSYDKYNVNTYTKEEIR